MAGIYGVKAVPHPVKFPHCSEIVVVIIIALIVCHNDGVFCHQIAGEQNSVLHIEHRYAPLRMAKGLKYLAAVATQIENLPFADGNRLDVFEEIVLGKIFKFPFMQKDLLKIAVSAGQWSSCPWVFTTIVGKSVMLRTASA